MKINISWRNELRTHIVIIRLDQQSGKTRGPRAINLRFYMGRSFKYPEIDFTWVEALNTLKLILHE